MSLKTATLIALICVLAQSAMWLLVTFEVVPHSKIWSLLNLAFSNGGMILFFAVLYIKQMTRTGGE